MSCGYKTNKKFIDFDKRKIHFQSNLPAQLIKTEILSPISSRIAVMVYLSAFKSLDNMEKILSSIHFNYVETIRT